MTIIRFPLAPRWPAGPATPLPGASSEAARLHGVAATHRVLVRWLLERRRPARVVLEAFQGDGERG